MDGWVGRLAAVITALSLCSKPGLTVWIFRRLNAHVRLALVQPGLPLAALLFQSRLSPAFCIDVGQVGWRVVIGLHALVILNLQWKRWQEWRGNGEGRQTQHVDPCFNQLQQVKKRGLLRTVWKEGMMIGRTHNCWRHIYWSAIRKPPHTLCKTTNLLCFVVIQIILFLLISEVPPHATDYLPNFP